MTLTEYTILEADISDDNNHLADTIVLTSQTVLAFGNEEETVLFLK